MSSLVENLSDIVGEYTDEKTYEILNNIDPKVYTSDKLFLKKLEGSNKSDMIIFAKANIFAKEFIKNNFVDKTSRIKNVDPVFLTGVAINFISASGDFDDIEDTFLYAKVEERIEEILSV